MGLRRLGRDGQSLRDLARRRATSDQREHLDLAGRESCRPGPPFAARLAGGGEHGVDRVGVESSGAHVGTELAARLIGRERRPVCPRLGHCLERAGSGEYAGGRGDRRGSESAVVAGAVAPLVDHRGDRADPRQRVRTGQHAFGVVRVQADLLPLVRRQWTLFGPDSC